MKKTIVNEGVHVIPPEPTIVEDVEVEDENQNSDSHFHDSANDISDLISELKESELFQRAVERVKQNTLMDEEKRNPKLVKMKEEEFVCRRASGETLEQICKAMRMSKSTAVKLSFKLQANVQHLSSIISSEKLREIKQELSHRVERNFDYLRRIDSEIDQKLTSVSELELSQLFKIKVEIEKSLMRAGEGLSILEMKDEWSARTFKKQR